jgi:class 3 adenylate cyclase
MSDIRSETPLLISFIDLTRFMAQSRRVGDVEVADILDEYYEAVGAAVEKGGGRVVKFIGDGALVVFPEEHVDSGVQTLLTLKESIDDLMTRRGWDCRLTAKAHFGVAVAGRFGVAGHKCYDVIGKAVNTAAAHGSLEGTGITLSVAAFRKLGPALRRRFKKHTPPISYIRNEDSRP